MNQEQFLRTDEGIYLLDCIENCERQFNALNDNLRAWPWVITGLASLVQTACVLYIRERNTTSVGAVHKHIAQKYRESIQHDYQGEPVSRKLAPPKDLIKSVQNYKNNIFCDRMKNDLVKLYDLRHNYMHFVPMSHSLEISGLPRISKHSLIAVTNMLSDKGMYANNRLAEDKRDWAINTCLQRLDWLNKNMDTSK